MFWFSLLLRFLNIPFLKDAETIYLRYNALNEMELLRRKSEPPNLIRHTMAMRSCAHSTLWRMATRIFFAVQIWDLEPDIVSCGTWTATKSDTVLLRMLFGKYLLKEDLLERVNHLWFVQQHVRLSEIRVPPKLVVKHG